MGYESSDHCKYKLNGVLCSVSAMLATSMPV